jgi:hypothetical protein
MISRSLAPQLAGNHPAAEKKNSRSELESAPHLTGTDVRSELTQRPQWAGKKPAVGWGKPTLNHGGFNSIPLPIGT